MSLGKELTSKLTHYPNEFWIDEHALSRVNSYHDLELMAVLDLLRMNNFSKVKANDSKQAELEHLDSYRVYIDKSNMYKYEIILYLTRGKPLVKTVSKLNRATQEHLTND